MEVVNAYKEDVAFTNVANTRDNTRGYVSGSSAKVGGTHPIGPWKTFKIKQGDVVNGEVYARYETSSTGSGINLSLYLTNPSNFRGGSESNRNPALLNLGLGLSPVTNPPAGVPKAQLRYLFYDKDNKFLSSQSVAVSAAATNSWLKLTLPQFTATQDGYLQVLVVNESNVDVWFDDLAITHTEALIVQENHYDPWGLNLAGIETQGQPDHKHQYLGQEKQDELGLNWLNFNFRQYDAQLGRFHAIDLLADAISAITPYQYGFNNPILFSDPSGLMPDEGEDFGGDLMAGGGPGPRKRGTKKAGNQYVYAPGRANSTASPTNNVNHDYLGSLLGSGSTSTVKPPLRQPETQKSSLTLPLPAVLPRAGEVVTQTTTRALLNAGVRTMFRYSFLSLLMLTGDTRSPTTIDIPTSYSDYVNDDGKITLFRGVHGTHPDLPNAYRGVANPWNLDPNVTAEQHNSGNVTGPWTSWTPLVDVANYRANATPGQPGVILMKKFSIRELTNRSARFVNKYPGEMDVQLQGTVYSATPIAPWTPPSGWTPYMKW